MKKGTILQIFVGIFLFVAFGFFHDQIFVGMLMATGRNQNCPAGQAVGSMSLGNWRHQRIAFMHANSKLLARDAEHNLEQWETPHGRFWLPRGSVKEVLYGLAEQDTNIYELGDNGAHKGDVVLDFGANVGSYTRKALRLGASKVVAVEPAPENLECLRRNLKDEIADGRVVLYPKGVWHKDDVLPLNVDPDNSAGDSFVIKRPGSHTVYLPLTTIDKMVDELKLDRVDFMKFDIEGAERRALEGGRNTLAKFHPRMAVCVYHLPDDPEAVPAAAKGGWAGYRYECGPCLVSDMRIMPEVFFFR
ncbi:MAG: FkbM family methyltransferase [Bryobacteraceae bacterium]|nr:FkbM family methyltransferase [Bryobacteraceae bacterium]